MKQILTVIDALIHGFSPVLRPTAVLVVILMVACNVQERSKVDPKVLEDTIIRYNSLLAEGYRTLNMNPLIQAATKESAQKAYYHMAALGEERRRMEATLERITFLHSTVTDETHAEMETDEEWKYVHYNIDTKEEVSRNSVHYRLKYLLVMEGGKWLVSDIEIEKEESGKEETL